MKIRFGLCCTFFKEPISFRTTRHSYLSRLPREKQREILDDIILSNLAALSKALVYCSAHSIGCFRITSTFFPLYTHPQSGYTLDDLPSAERIFSLFSECKTFAHAHSIRLSFHPDQFTVLNSPSPDVVKQSVQDLAYHTMLADLLGADVITIHLGGAYGNKKAAIARFCETFTDLPEKTKCCLALENDDKSYTPEDLLPLCQKLKLPLVYDVHHHRCNPDTLTVEHASRQAYDTWKREPLFHLSSPREGWNNPHPERHRDYIRLEDFPLFWKKLTPLTVEIEAKAKEEAVKKIMSQIYP